MERSGRFQLACFEKLGLALTILCLLYQVNGNRYILIIYNIMDLGQGKHKTDGKYRPLCSLYLNMHRSKICNLHRLKMDVAQP